MTEPREAEPRLDAVYVTYWSLGDPLCQSQSLPVLRALTEAGWRFGLITYEHPLWRKPAREAAEESARLQAQGITWRPLRYHKRPPILSTVFDILRGAWRVARWQRQSGARLVHTRGTVPGAVGFLASRLRPLRFFNDADGPLADEYADAGVWRRGSLAHRLTRAAEGRFLAVADDVAVLTTHRRQEVAAATRRTPVVLPCAVDVAFFRPRPETRAALRERLGLRGVVFVHAGKAGGWYRTEAMLDFVAAARDVLGEVSLLVLTREDAEPFRRLIAKRGLRFAITGATRDEMPAYLSAADAGLCFLIEAPSKLACSPVKNGEYLACGLPIVITPGAGDYSALVARERLGTVLASVDTAGFHQAARDVAALLREPDLAERCRRAAAREAGLREVVVPRYLEVYAHLLGLARPEA